MSQQARGARPLIAIIDANDAIREVLDHVLTDEGYATLLYPPLVDTHYQIRLAKPDLIILDVWLKQPEAGGMLLGLFELDRTTRTIPCIIMSADVKALRQLEPMLQRRGYGILEKPFDLDALLALVARMLQPRGEDASSSDPLS